MGYGGSFKDYMFDFQTLMRPLGYSTKEMSTPTPVVLLGVRESRRQKRRMLLTDGKWPAVLAAERRVRVARCYLSKLTGKLIEEEQQLSAAVTIGGGTYKATIDTGTSRQPRNTERATRKRPRQ